MKRRIVSFLLVVVMCAVVPAYVVFANTTALMEAAPIGESMEIASATPAEGVPAEVPAEAPVEGDEAGYVHQPTVENVIDDASLVAPTIRTVTYGNFEGQNPMIHVSCADPDGHKVLEVYTLKEGYNEGDGMGRIESDDGKVYTIVGIQTLERNMENVWEDEDGTLHMKTELYSGDNGEYRPNPGDQVTVTISGEVQDESGYHEEIAKGVDITVPEVGEIVDVEVTSEPTTEPTVEPTVEPTTEPTTEPTVEPTTEPSVQDHRALRPADD